MANHENLLWQKAAFAMIDLQDYWNRLNRHDWTFEFSDDPGVYRAGLAAERELLRLSEQSSEHAALYKAFRKHYLADVGERHLHPKPEKPGEPRGGARAGGSK